MSESDKTVTWQELGAFSEGKTSFAHEDWIELYKLNERLDPSTIPEGIEFPDLRPREMIEAEAREKQAKEDS